MPTAKEVAIEILHSLPDDCTLDDIEWRLYLRRKLDRSAKDIENGRVYSKEEVKEMVKNWSTSSGPKKPSQT